MGYSLLNAKTNMGITNDVMFAYVRTKINIMLSVLSIWFVLFYDFNMNTKGCVHWEFVKYQRDLHWNVQIFAKWKVCISAIQIFYIQTCPGFLPISKWIVYLSEARVNKNWVLESILYSLFKVVDFLVWVDTLVSESDITYTFTNKNHFLSSKWLNGDIFY